MTAERSGCRFQVISQAFTAVIKPQRRRGNVYPCRPSLLTYYDIAGFAFSLNCILRVLPLFTRLDETHRRHGCFSHKLFPVCALNGDSSRKMLSWHLQSHQSDLRKEACHAILITDSELRPITSPSPITRFAGIILTFFAEHLVASPTTLIRPFGCLLRIRYCILKVTQCPLIDNICFSKRDSMTPTPDYVFFMTCLGSLHASRKDRRFAGVVLFCRSHLSST